MRTMKVVLNSLIVVIGLFVASNVFAVSSPMLRGYVYDHDAEYIDQRIYMNTEKLIGKTIKEKEVMSVFIENNRMHVLYRYEGKLIEREYYIDDTPEPFWRKRLEKEEEWETIIEILKE